MSESKTVYRCACGFSGSLDQVIDHVAQAVKTDKRHYSEGGHAVMLREMRKP